MRLWYLLRFKRREVQKHLLIATIHRGMRVVAEPRLQLTLSMLTRASSLLLNCSIKNENKETILLLLLLHQHQQQRQRPQCCHLNHYKNARQLSSQKTVLMYTNYMARLSTAAAPLVATTMPMSRTSSLVTGTILMTRQCR